MAVSILSLAIGGIAGLRSGVPLSADAVAFAIACAIYAVAAARLVVGWLIGFAPTRGFVPLAWYRIALGFVVAATLVSGIVKWTP